MERGHLAEFLRSSTRDLFGIPLADQQLEQLMIYLDQLKAWNASTNLTSITVDEDIVVKHFIDSLAALSADVISQGVKVLDVGSGAGFPGIPMKIVRPDLFVTLLEPAHKKASFLHFVVGVLRLPGVSIVAETLERFITERGGQFDYVVTRALRYDIVLRFARSLLKQGGKILLYTSRPIAAEGRHDWSLVKEFQFDLPRQGGKRVVSVLQAAA
ncbi:16S rRNA (guanine(527)-N(7))-methyltransferase RsmG [Nitrospira moscoviensis]|uniref:Ribosomal RNA small subunit methyltransferase G n=1 Tax=Nitrospira moscoviensis TaxID=42253 RepID=A0A0K2G6Z8_NITMO|nr:16S rRNA (guanine(527)-N(7))-methyltransferase RsmG [Nitrospira moscoviensis]ALA56728.1 putative Ribosomal RNA small subunit methyltransferase G [Nitrospira moscoviensis]